MHDTSAGAQVAGLPPDRAAGFRFLVDTIGETGPNAGVLAAVRGAVTFVAGRGRLDVVAVPRAPTLSVRGVRIAAPLAAPGDYYLFDSAGAVLVHPTTRTFSRLALADGSYNYEERRDGWPAAFQMEPTRPETLRGASAVSARVTPHGPVPIYWHLDLKAVPPSPPIRIIARGRVQLVDAPAGEASVARWFGAAEALATLPGGVAATRGAPLRVTAVVALQSPGDSAAVVNLVTQVPLADLAPAAVDRSRLVLPPNFTEVPLDERASAPRPAPPAANDVARWRVLAPATVASGHAPASPDAMVRATLGGMYEALVSADTAALRYWLADDLVWTDGVSGADVTKDQVLAILGGRRMDGLPPRTERDSIRVDARRRGVRPLPPRRSPTVRRRRLPDPLARFDAFVERDGRWQLVRHTQTWLVEPVAAVALDSAAQQAFVGRYEVAPGYVDDVHWAGGHLVAMLTGYPPGATLVPVGASVFSPDGTGALIAFERDATGRVIGYVQGYPDGASSGGGSCRESGPARRAPGAPSSAGGRSGRTARRLDGAGQTAVRQVGTCLSRAPACRDVAERPTFISGALLGALAAADAEKQIGAATTTARRDLVPRPAPPNESVAATASAESRSGAGRTRWVELSAAITAVVVSVGSLLIARHQAEVMDRQSQRRYGRSSSTARAT